MFGYLAYIFVVLFYVFMLKVECAEILAVFAHPNPERYLVAHAYLSELANRGHNITLISHNFENINLTQFRHIEIEYEDFNKLIVLEDKEAQRIFLKAMHKNISRSVLQHPKVIKMMSEKSRRFDLVVIDVNLPRALYGLGPHFKAHLVGVSATPAGQEIDHLVGNISPISTIPLDSLGYIRVMDIFARYINMKQFIFEWIQIYIDKWFPQEILFQQHFRHLHTSLRKVYKNFSLVLVNQHFSLSFPRPYVPAMVEVGGMHINHKPALLPNDIAEFIDGAINGVIYFSMGANFKSNDFPQEKINITLKVFRKLKQRIIWKFDQTTLPGKPDNVLIGNHFSDSDILVHPNVRLFITHAGLLSTFETIHFAKPIVGIFLNMDQAKLTRFGKRINYHKFNEIDLMIAIKHLLKNRKYQRTINEISERYHDQPMRPLEKAIYWTEYVLRYKGAPHMRVAAQNLS